MMTYILRITDDTDTADLVSDDFSLNTSGWAPTAAEDGDVPESLSINILNGQPGGGTASGSKWRFRQNKAKLRRLLRNAQKFGQGDSTVAPVRLEYAPQHGDPGVLWASLLVGWDDTQFLPPTTNDADGQTTEQLNGVTLNVTRRAPLLHTEYLYPNLLSNSAPMTGWTGSPQALSTAAITGAYGGTARIRSTASGFGNQAAYVAMPVASGETYTVSGTYGTNGTNPGTVTVAFKDATRATLRSNAATFAADSTAVITDGTRFSVTLTAIATDASAVLEVKFATASQTLDLAEVMVQVGSVDETWHPTDTELTQSSTSGSAQNPSIHEISFVGDLDTPSPVTLVMTDLTTATLADIQPGYIIVTDQLALDGLELKSAWTPTPSAAFTNVADATAKAVGGTVNRYTPATTARTGSGKVSLNEPWAGRIQIYAAVRNNSATATYYLQAELSAQNLLAPGRRVEIAPAATPTPQIISLGEVTSVDGLTDIQLWYEVNAVPAGAAGTKELDVDYVVLVRMTENTHIIPHGNFSVSTYVAGSYELEIDPRALTSVAPYVGVNDLAMPGVSVRPDYIRSDVRLRMTGNRLSVLWLAPMTLAGVRYWRHVDNTAAAAASVRWRAERLPATDVPL